MRAIAVAQRGRQPAAAGTHVLEERPQPRVVIRREQLRRIRPAQKIHVGARRLLRRVMTQLTQEGHRMRRVEDHQACQQVRPRSGEVPRRRTAPVVRDQKIEGCAGRTGRAGHRPDQRREVLHDVPRTVSLDLDRRRRASEAAQIGRDGDRLAREPLEDLVPGEGALREAVQQQDPRQTGGGPATRGERRVVAATDEGDAMRQHSVEGVEGCAHAGSIAPTRGGGKVSTGPP